MWFICKRTCATPIAYCELIEDEDEEATNGITLAPSQGTGTDIAQLPVNGIVGMKLWCEDSGYGGVGPQCDALGYGCGASAGWYRVQYMYIYIHIFKYLLNSHISPEAKV